LANTGIWVILQKSSANQEIQTILWNLRFQEINWSSHMMFLQELIYDTFIYNHVLMIYLICDPEAKLCKYFCLAKHVQ
jgi:hypothetical protein